MGFWAPPGIGIANKSSSMYSATKGDGEEFLKKDKGGKKEVLLRRKIRLIEGNAKCRHLKKIDL
jgi:hypothetical protein